MCVHKHITSGGHLKLTLMILMCLHIFVGAFSPMFLVPACVYTDYWVPRGCNESFTSPTGGGQPSKGARIKTIPITSIIVK